jgi:hypothetical protein
MLFTILILILCVGKCSLVFPDTNDTGTTGLIISGRKISSFEVR